MEVISKPSFNKEMKRCPAFIQKKVHDVIISLKAAENLQKSGLDYKKCRGGKNENYYRIRVGDWRIGVELKHPAVIIITILTRGLIYKKFLPK